MRTSYQEWIGCDVSDPSGVRIGSVTDVYADDATGRPEWLRVRTSDEDTRFIPIQGSAEGTDGTLRVGYTLDRVRDAPSVDVDEGHLDADEERELWNYFEFDYDARDETSGYFGYGDPRDRADEAYYGTPVAASGQPASVRLRRYSDEVTP